MGLLLRRRLVTAIPTLFLVTVIVFALQLLIPGGPAQALAGENASPQAVAALKHELGVDRPLVVQYGSWVAGLARGDLGASMQTRQPVTQIVAGRVLPTVELLGGALALALILGGAAGVWAAVRRRHGDGRSVFAVSGLALSVPDFWLATIGAGLFGLTLAWVPAVGFTPPGVSLSDNLRSVALPVLVLTVTPAALICRHLRSSMSAALDSVHVRTAWAIGLTARRVYVEDGLRTSLGPVITYLPLAVSGLVGAAVVVENVFNIPGLGTAIVQAVDNRDFTTIQGIVLLKAVLIVVLNLIADLLAAAVDPRVRRGVA